ncbi:hypothetical protein ACFP65_00825 [Marinilactibacillus sp. GCM10026970]|uniref:hypothetical protein n=1 Tax=Marinilactibacillus sp. GCM10026970 TaxID=3252642 RepID=UPI00360681B0
MKRTESVKEMTERNEEISKTLYIENQKYYEKLADYVRYGSYFKNEKEIEEFLLQVLEDILQAQKEGVSAEIYFGKDPKSSADELLATLKFDWLGILKTFGVVFSFYFFFAFAVGNSSVDIISFVVRILGITIAVGMIVNILQKGIYTKRNSRKNRLLSKLLIGLILLPIILLEFFFKTNLFVIEFPYLLVANLVFLAALMITWKYFKTPKEKRDIWSILMMATWGSLFMGIMNHIVMPFLINR